MLACPAKALRRRQALILLLSPCVPLYPGRLASTGERLWCETVQAASVSGVALFPALRSPRRNADLRSALSKTPKGEVKTPLPAAYHYRRERQERSLPAHPAEPPLQASPAPRSLRRETRASTKEDSRPPHRGRTLASGATSKIRTIAAAFHARPTGTTPPLTSHTIPLPLLHAQHRRY